MLNLCNNNKNEFNQLALSAISEGVAGMEDLKRVVFDVYATLCYQGFYSDELMGYHDVLDNIPKEYIPCDESQVSSFFVTHVTIDRTVKKYRDFLYSMAELDNRDNQVIESIVNNLPMTMTQINSKLLEGNVTPNKLSSRAISSLFNELYDSNVDSKSVLLFKSSKSLRDDGTRYERNTRPSFTAFCREEDEKKLKALSTVLVRACEIVGRILGFVDHSHIVDLIDSLHKEKVDSLFSNWKNYREYVISVISEKYGDNYGGRFAISDNIEYSELYRWLYYYLSIKGEISKCQFVEFISKVLEFKLAINLASKKDKGKEQVAVAGISASFDKSYITLDVIDELTRNIDFVTLDGELIKLKSGEYRDFDDNFSLAVTIGMEYLSAGNRFFRKTSLEKMVDTLQTRYSKSFRDELLNAIKFPDGMFIVDDQYLSVDAKCITIADNRRGKYHRAEHLELADEIFLLRQELQDLTIAKREGFKKMIKSFLASYKATKNHLPDIIAEPNHVNHEQYMNERDAILSYGDFDSAKMYLTNEIRRCDKQMRSLSKYEAYLESIDGIDGADYSVSLRNVRERYNKWFYVRTVDLDKLERLKYTQTNQALSELRKKIELLERESASLRIRHNEYKAHLLIHDYLVSTTRKPVEEVLMFIESYCLVLATNKVPQSCNLTSPKQFDGVYYNLRRLLTTFVESHPFAIYED